VIFIFQVEEGFVMDLLVVRLSSLGDLVLAQPLVTALAEAGHRVTLLTKPENRALGAMFPGLAKVAVSPLELNPAYDIVLDLHGTLRARRWSRKAPSVSRVRYAKHALARRLLVRPGGHPVFWNAWSGLRGRVSVADWYAQAARRAGLTFTLQAPRLEIPAQAQAEAESLLRQAGLSPQERWAALAPGARWPTKQWPLEFFAALAARLEQAADVRAAVVGGPGEERMGQDLMRRAGGRAVSLAGQSSVPVLAALLSRCALFAGNDSGPMHLAMAAGAPVLAFFGPTVAGFGFMPLASPRVRILERPLDCRPCSLHGARRCPLGHHDCLRQIGPEEAFQAAKPLLDWSGGGQ
jgi:heptosyltransferase-2